MRDNDYRREAQKILTHTAVILHQANILLNILMQ